jgi:DNA-binding response OmpR family regulator
VGLDAGADDFIVKPFDLENSARACRAPHRAASAPGRHRA